VLLVTFPQTVFIVDCQSSLHQLSNPCTALLGDIDPCAALLGDIDLYTTAKLDDVPVRRRPLCLMIAQLTVSVFTHQNEGINASYHLKNRFCLYAQK
jgi:hypothetical protein